MTARAPLIVVLLAIMGGAAGCSSGSPPSKSVAPTTGSRSTTTVPVTTTPTTSATATTAVPPTGLCTAADLTPSWPGASNGASGTVYYAVNLMNTSSAPCASGGYVGVSAYDPAGTLITSTDNRQADLGEGTATAPPTLTVLPGASVNFMVGFADSNEADGGSNCGIEVGALHLIPPNEFSSVQIATPTQGGYPALCGGTILVGPLENGVDTP